MWASSPTLSRPFPFVPKLNVAASTTTNPPNRRFTLAVTNKFHRRPPPHNDGSNHHSSSSSSAEDIGASGLGVLTALKSNPQTKSLDSRGQNSASSIKISNPKQQQKQQQRKSMEEKEVVEREMSGSDVLKALQRATALKIKRKPRDSFPAKNRGRRSVVEQVVVDEGEDDSNYGDDVRPICVKSEWSSRLDGLEKDLQELIHEIQ